MKSIYEAVQNKVLVYLIMKYGKTSSKENFNLQRLPWLPRNIERI